MIFQCERQLSNLFSYHIVLYIFNHSIKLQISHMLYSIHWVLMLYMVSISNISLVKSIVLISFDVNIIAPSYEDSQSTISFFIYYMALIFLHTWIFFAIFRSRWMILFWMMLIYFGELLLHCLYYCNDG